MEKYQWTKSTKNGMAFIAILLGILSLGGSHQVEAVDIDYSNMDFTTLSMRAEQGDVNAQAWLATTFSLGLQGVAENKKKALFWWTKAAEQRNPTAQFQLGLMYSYGVGVLEDLIKSYAWFNLAALQGDGIATRKRDTLLEMMTPKQIESGQRLFRELQKKINKTK